MLELTDIRKCFGTLTALDGVGVRFAGGRVHGVLGENGAGKSTLMNVAYGMARADAGEVRVDGVRVQFRSPRDAIAARVGMVHQHFMLAGAMSVLDNVLLGDRRQGLWLDRRAASARLAEMADGLGLPVDPAARADQLSVGQQQRVEILKALWRDVRVLILDEPTAVLTPVEVEQLFAAVGRLRAQGRAVVFISHKLGEVKRICDDLTVLRRGRVVWRGDAAGVSARELAGVMVGENGDLGAGEGPGGREGLAVQTRMPTPPGIGEGGGRSTPGGFQGQTRMCAPPGGSGGPRLVLESVSVGGLREVSLSIAAGEIAGIAGVDGNGQQALAEVVVGLRGPGVGRVVVDGVDVSGWGLKRRLGLGVAHIPNDRKLEALAVSMGVTENLALKAYDRPPIGRAGVTSWRVARGVAEDLMKRFDVRAASAKTPVGTLSGGNQQKVVLARELGGRDARLVVATNPVRGLDIAATNFVYGQLLARRAAGAAVLLISSDLDELLALCDRIGVLYAGRLTMTDFPRGAGREEIGRRMAGLA